MIELFRRENQPMHLIGRDLSIPDWVINLRHGLAHGTGEINIDQLFMALEVVFDSLVSNPKNYWSQQSAVFEQATREVTRDEQNALKRLAVKLFNEVDKARKLEDNLEETLDEVRFFCEEAIYQKYFVTLIVQQLMAIDDTYQLDKCVKCIDQLTYTPEVCFAICQCYSCNYESK